jgi:hypothetical protein
MPFSLRLPKRLDDRGWKVKIWEAEGPETPHVTFVRGRQWYRFDIRAGRFLDKDPDPREVPRKLVEFARRRLPALRGEWDRMHPENPVTSEPDDEDDEDRDHE